VGEFDRARLSNDLLVRWRDKVVCSSPGVAVDKMWRSSLRYPKGSECSLRPGASLHKLREAAVTAFALQERMQVWRSIISDSGMPSKGGEHHRFAFNLDHGFMLQ
jgi:hypothetical protein